jgi:UDP-N-acetylglucosamine--N-acetylmuramyl-(pentapeptide) pyrophosphoryl-undecaprenol N-acetylglucosamine transferase
MKARPHVEVVFAGTERGIETRVIPALGYRLEKIRISGFRRKASIDAATLPFKIIMALVQSHKLIRTFGPDIVVGTGGYVAGPVLFMASMLRVPTLIHEQNSSPGVTTRLLASRVDKVCVTYETSLRQLRNARSIEVTGNPTRDVIGTISRHEARRFFGLRENGQTLLVFGGSQGARSLNKALVSRLPELVRKGFQILWQTGREDAGEAKAAAAQCGNESSVAVFDFIERMEYAYGASDLAVCRSGATTLSELSRAGVPSVLVPYPHAVADHQTENARVMVAAGASILLSDKDVRDQLGDVVSRLLSDEERLRRMSGCARAMSNPKAAIRLAQTAIELVEGSDVG